MLAENGLSKVNPYHVLFQGVSPLSLASLKAFRVLTKYSDSPKPQTPARFSSLPSQVEDSNCRVLDGVSVLARVCLDETSRNEQKHHMWPFRVRNLPSDS